MKEQYFHQFKTIDYAAAVDFYKANKLTMWDKGVEGDVEGNQEDGEGEGGGNFHEHKAKTDVQGQNVQEDNGDSKDNDDEQDNEEEQRKNQDIIHSP